MTKSTKEIVIEVINKREVRINKAGLILTNQVRTQITNRALTILEGTEVPTKKAIDAAVTKATTATVKYAKETVNEDAVYLVREGSTQNIGLVTGIEMAGNIDLIALESVIALALSNGETTQYPTEVSNTRGMAKIEDHVETVLANTVDKDKCLLTIGAYVSIISNEKLEAIMADIVEKCKKARNGAAKKMMAFVEAKKAFEESVDTAVEAGVPTEKIIKNEEELKEFFEGSTSEETPATDESSVAEETNTEKDDVEMKQENQLQTYRIVVDGVEIDVLPVAAFNDAITRMDDAMAQMAERYEGVIARMADERNAAVDEMVYHNNLDKDNLIKNLKADLSKVTASKTDLEKRVTKLESLRKADERKIEKLKDEAGRVKTQLRAHKVRELSKDAVIEAPEGTTLTGVVKARVATAASLENTATKIHKQAPVKIAAAADKTKDGIQWTAEKAKDAVEGIAKGTNWATEKTANSLTYVAEKIAPTPAAVAENIIAQSKDKQTVTVAGQVFRLDANGKLI